MTDDDRTPPHNIDAEQAALGAMLLSPAAIETIAGILDPADFYRPAHQTIYAAIRDLHGRSSAPRVDPITLAAELEDRGDLTRVGGPAYLHHLVQTTPATANADYHAEIILGRAKLRRIIEAATRITQMAYGNGDPAEILDAALAELQAAAGNGNPTDHKLSVADRWDGFLGELEAGRDPNAIDTPWPDLNAAVELKPGQLITVGATTGGGKSLLGLNAAAHVALTLGRPVLVASMEMGGPELMARLTAAEASVNVDNLVRRKVTDNDWVKIIKASDRLQNARNFILDDSPNLTLAKIRSRIRWMASRGMPPAMVVADYLQLLTPEKSKGDKNRATEVAELSRGLKLLAMEFEIPVIALAQFNRNAAGRQPVLSDFKDSSAIEQDSNVIVLMHRPLADDGSDTGPRAGEIDLIVAKNRNGAAGRIVPLSFQGHYARLRSMEREF